jgi:Fe-S oxidoreductase
LLAGSEGTLGIVTEVKLRTVSLPSATGVIQFEFENLSDMARAVPKIVETGASGCELMDNTLINMAIESLPEYRDILSENAAAILCVEHFGADNKTVERKMEATDSAVGELASSRRKILDTKQQKRLAKARKDAVPLLYRTNTKRKPIPFIEDISVDNSRLDEYITGLEEIARDNETQMVYYGHAGDGELHIRPYLDLGREDDISRMRNIADRAFTLAWSLGGTISGEHAEGLVRAAFLRKQYGDKFYEILCEVKNIFDPHSVLNPGKILNDDADIMVKNLKASQGISPERLESELNFRDEELEIELEKCNGCGLCLSRESDLRMCPVFRATNDKMSSSRVKADLLRYWAGGGLDNELLESEEFHRILSLCVNCKACSLQCPSGVDISKLVTAGRTRLAEKQGLTVAQRMLSLNRYLSKAGSLFAPLSNFVTSFPPFKWFLEKTAGLDKQRDMPAFEKGEFLKKGRKYLEGYAPLEHPSEKAAYFVDIFANYNDHSLGFAVLKVLRYNGIDVQLPKQRPAPVPAMYYGYQKAARKDLEYNAEYLLQAVENGRKIVCSEPSAALCLKQELRHYIGTELAEKISANTYELMEYLEGLYKEGKLQEPVTKQEGNFGYHQPCHLFALGNNAPGFRLLKEMLDIDITDLNAGCCGLAGTFGMQKKNYQLSRAISQNLRKALLSGNYSAVITECAACGMQIEHISNLKTIHPIKIISRAYSLD